MSLLSISSPGNFCSGTFVISWPFILCLIEVSHRDLLSIVIGRLEIKCFEKVLL